MSEALVAIDEVLAPLGARFSTEEPFRPANIRGIFADDASSTIIVLRDGSGMTRIGTSYENTYAWLMTLRDGAVVDGTAFYDSISFNELWAKVSPAAQSSDGASGGDRGRARPSSSATQHTAT